MDQSPPPGPLQAANRTDAEVEQLIATARQRLRESTLGECGAQAIHDDLKARHPSCPVPCIRTIGRVLRRLGLLNTRARGRRSPPPRGWYLPELAEGRAELDSFDIVEGLFIAGGTEVEVLNAASLHGRLVGSWPQGRFTAPAVMDCLMEHWQRHGLPAYAQFDNAPLFQGAISYADCLGRVVRLCLLLGVTPVFAPPRETGFQAAIESYNARWQTQVWHRFVHDDFKALQKRSAAYVQACQSKTAASIATASLHRSTYPHSFSFQPDKALTRTVIFLRRTTRLAAPLSWADTTKSMRNGSTGS